MEPLGRPEMSANNQTSTQRNVPEERRSHLHCDGSLNHALSCKVLYLRTMGYILMAVEVVINHECKME
jgi:hypothetical protein